MGDAAPVTESSLRQRLQFHVPRAETPPHGVRAWLGAYLRYRGVDDKRARAFIWSGADLRRADRAALRDAFRAHCPGCQDWEADLMAADVEAFVRASLPTVPLLNRVRAALMRRLLLREDCGWGSLLLWLLTIVGFLWFVRALVDVVLERFARAFAA